MIDDARIREMKDMFGDAEFVELVGLFREEGEAIIVGLQDRVGSDLSASLHSLCGIAENMGLYDLSARCRMGEAQIARGETMDPRSIKAAFEDGLHSLSIRAGLP